MLQSQALAAALHDLTAEVQRQEAAGLEACLEYALLPLLFLVDSTVATRTTAAGMYRTAFTSTLTLQWSLMRGIEIHGHWKLQLGAKGVG